MILLCNQTFAQKSSGNGLLIPNELISIALNGTEIKEYYHFDISERGNLVVVNQNWLHNPLDTILVFDKQVKIVNTLDSTLTNFIQVVFIKQEGDKIELKFKYKLEGLLIDVELVKLNEIWQRKSVSIVEN